MKYRLNDLLIDTETQRVYRGDSLLDVSGLSFRLLEYLLRQGSRVATFDDIVSAVWFPMQVSNDTVTQRVRLLRIALQDQREGPAYIRSVRSVGYQLCSAPEPVTECKPASASPRIARSYYYALVPVVSIVSLLVFLIHSTPESSAKVRSRYAQTMDRALYFLHQREAKDIERGLNLLAKVETEGSGDPEWLLAKSLMLSTQVCRFGADLTVADEAMKLAEQAVALAGETAQAAYATAYNNDCRGYSDKAIAGYRQVIELMPQGQGVAKSALAYLLGETGMLAQSLALHKELEAESEYDDFLSLQIGRNFALLQFTSLAEQYYRYSFELYPENIFSNAAYPAFLFSVGLNERSEQILALAESRPHHADLYLTKAEHALARGERAGARDALRQAISMKADFPFYRTLLALHENTPDISMLSLRFDELTASAEMPVRATSLLEIALISTHFGDTHQAGKALRQAIASGFMEKDYLQRSYLLASLRQLPGYEEALEELSARVEAERAKVPAEYLTLTAIGQI